MENVQVHLKQSILGTNHEFIALLVKINGWEKVEVIVIIINTTS